MYFDVDPHTQVSFSYFTSHYMVGVLLSPQWQMSLEGAVRYTLQIMVNLSPS